MGVETDNFNSKDPTEKNRSLNLLPTSTYPLVVPSSSKNLSPIAGNGRYENANSAVELPPIGFMQYARDHRIEQGSSSISDNIHSNPQASAPDIDEITESGPPANSRKPPSIGFLNLLADNPYASESELSPFYEKAENIINPISSVISTNAEENPSNVKISTKNRKYCKSITGVCPFVNISRCTDYIRTEPNKGMSSNELFVVITIVVICMFTVLCIWIAIKNNNL